MNLLLFVTNESKLLINIHLRLYRAFWWSYAEKRRDNRHPSALLQECYSDGM